MSPRSPDSNDAPKEKGKGRQEELETQSKTFIARVASAAARLTCDVVSSPGPGQYSLDPTVSGKPGSSGRTHNSSAAQEQQTAQVVHPESSSSQQSTFGSFDPQHPPAVAGEEFSAFLTTTSQGSSIGTSRQTRLTSRVSDASTGASLHDGSAVVSLLQKSPEWSIEAQDAEPGLTNTEGAALHRALFENGAGSSMSQMNWNDALSLVPDFASPNSEELRAHLGTRDAVEARNIWLQQWQQVLTSYTDEVWGGLGDLVEEARQELDEMASRGGGYGMGTPSVKAVRRLQQVLKHVRASHNRCAE